MRGYGSSVQLKLGHHLSSAFYRLGLEPDDADVIRHGLLALGIDPEPVFSEWYSKAARSGVQQWMIESQRKGVKTYPSVLVELDDHHRVQVSAGYELASAVWNKIQQIEVSKKV